MWNAEWGVRIGDWGVPIGECGMTIAHLGVRIDKCGMTNAEWGKLELDFSFPGCTWERNCSISCAME